MSSNDSRRDIGAMSGACPRCRGQLFEEMDGEFHCLQCGCIVYAPGQTRLPLDPGVMRRLPSPNGSG